MYDLSGQVLARRIFEDIEAYKSRNIDGLIACGSQRSFFPNGFAYYVFARKQYDISLSFEELFEDYYSHAYGEDYKLFADYLSELGDAFGFGFMEGEASEDVSVSPFFSPQRAKRLEAVSSIVEKGRALIDAHYDSPDRVKTVSARLLEVQSEYALLLAEAIRLKALDKDEEALEFFDRNIAPYLSVKSMQYERYFDFELTVMKIRAIIKQKSARAVQF